MMENITPTKYVLETVATGRRFEDEGWTLNDPECGEPSLVRAVYEKKQICFGDEALGIYKFADWMPVTRILKGSCAPVTYKSKGLAEYLGLENLYITFSGWNPEIGATMRTCSFKETEAYSVLARLKENSGKTLIIQSAGNTARAFAQVCSDNQIPVVICIPEDCCEDMWFGGKLDDCVKLVAVPHGCDYYDAIAVGEKLAADPRYLLEGGAKNVARRDGMGTTVLSFAQKTGRIPDAYFQAVGSGTGAIAAWENACRLGADGRFGRNGMRVYVAQNEPFTLMYDAWRNRSRSLPSLDPVVGRHQAEIIIAKVLSNRKPPYGLKGGLYDALLESGGDMSLATNNEIVRWLVRYRNLEGYELLPASCVAVAALAQAVASGVVKKDEFIMLNCTGGGSLAAMDRGCVHKRPDLVISPELGAEETMKKVSGLTY
jgi:cysteate synthase